MSLTVAVQMDPLDGHGVDGSLRLAEPLEHRLRALPRGRRQGRAIDDPEDLGKAPVRMIVLVHPAIEPTLPIEMSALLPKKSAHSSQPLSAVPWKFLTGSLTASCPSRYSTIIFPWITSILETRSRSTRRRSRSSRRMRPS